MSTDGGDGSISLNGVEEDDEEDEIEVDDAYLAQQGFFGRNESSLADELGGGAPSRLGDGDELVEGLDSELMA